jgi:hypothetical protein
MPKDRAIAKDDFLKLTTEETCKIVTQMGKPLVGIFLPDGNRRLLMCRTKLDPTSEAFYEAYARDFLETFKESLVIFFDHGLKTLFLPLVGPSQLARKNKFQEIAVPIVYNELFKGSHWLDFFKKKGIRVKTYGDVSQLDKIDIHRLNMIDGINRLVEKTASQDKHGLFLGFLSDHTPGLEMPQHIIKFYQTHHRTPTQQEMLQIYYGEVVPDADFIILSGKLSGHGAFPPFISTRQARMYFSPVPGFLGLSKMNYRRIIYDLLFMQTLNPIPEYTPGYLENIEELNQFYQENKDKIFGTNKKIGKFNVLDI